VPTAVDGKGFSNIAANTATFPLKGGSYGVTAVATFGGGSVKLQRLALDGSTFVSMTSATDFAVAGGTVQNLPLGTYRFTIATATAVFAEVQGIPTS
jgi:hypothetical protein